MRSTSRRPRSRSLVTAVAAIAMGLLASASPVAAAAPAVVILGSAASFAVLAGGGISDTGPSQVTGDVGTYPRPAVSDQLDRSASGTVHRGGEAARLAQRDLAEAYALASGASATGRVAGGTAARSALPGGVYVIERSAQGAAGSLALDAGGDPGTTWIFQVASGLDTEPTSTITLVNGAQSCNVFWQVAGDIRLGAGSTFAGTILAASTVTVGSDVRVDGRLLAMTKSVSLDGDTIAAPACAHGVAPSMVPVAAAPVNTVVAASPGRATPDRAQRAPGTLLLAAGAALLLALVLGEPRRGRRPIRSRW